MPVIDPHGLFDGKRINQCSVMAQLYYPRLLAASNGFGRIQINYLRIVADAFPRWRPEDLPSESSVKGYFKEYAEKRLIFLYRSNGKLWGQWDSKKNTFGKYQTSEDKRSPEPNLTEFSKWQEENRRRSSDPSETVDDLSTEFPDLAEILPEGSEKLPHGIGVGTGEGIRHEVLGKKPSARKTRGPRSQATQKSQATGQTRHARIQELVQGFYADWAGAECPWGPGEGSQLSEMLKSTPGWLDQQFVTCLDHLARSDCVPKAARPREWLGKLPKFLHGPLDQYWKSKGVVNGKGTHQTAQAGRAARNVEALIRSSLGNSVQRDDVHHGGTVQHGTASSGGGQTDSFPDGEILAREPPGAKP